MSEHDEQRKNRKPYKIFIVAISLDRRAVMWFNRLRHARMIASVFRECGKKVSVFKWSMWPYKGRG